MTMTMPTDVSTRDGGLGLRRAPGGKSRDDSSPHWAKHEFLNRLKKRESFRISFINYATCDLYNFCLPLYFHLLTNPNSKCFHTTSFSAWCIQVTWSSRPFKLEWGVVLYSSWYMCHLMSPAHLALGRPTLRWYFAVLILCVGSHVSASIFQESSPDVIILRARFHFRLRCSVTQSSIFSFFILSSASCVLRLIQSTHGSNVGSISSVFRAGSSLFGSLVTSLPSVSECATMVLRGIWTIIRNICLWIFCIRCSSSVVIVHASHP